MTKLDGPALHAQLAQVPHWRFDEDAHAIERRFAFKDFNEAFAFMTRVALLAEKGWLNGGVWVYVETEQAPDSLTLPPGLVLHRQTRAGLVHALLYHVADAAEAPDAGVAGQGEKNRAGELAAEPA